MLANTVWEFATLSLIVVETEPKSPFATEQHSLREKMTNLEFVELKMIDDRDLFIGFLKSQHKLPESEGLAFQLAKMDVKTFKKFMKAALAVDSDWPTWRKAPVEMSRD